MTEEERKSRLVKWAEIRHFTPDEFDSPDQPGSGLYMSLEFIRLLDQGRSKTGFPWKITSGYRTEAHNLKVGGQGPEHCLGLAADIQAPTGAEKFAIVKWAIGAGFKRLGIGKHYVHLGFSLVLPQDVLWHYYP